MYHYSLSCHGPHPHAHKKHRKNAIVIGAGPAGLTAAYELLDKTDIVPTIFEMTNDIGGHRFFSKSDRVMDWWLNIFPLQGAPARDDLLVDRQMTLADTCRIRPLGTAEPVVIPSPDPERTDGVMLARSRLSRIFFLRRFFKYPISLDFDTLVNLGMNRVSKIGLSYLKTRLMPIRKEKSLEDFLINRFGRELYLTFFKDYTEKVWGACCRDINPDWGVQRIRGLSVGKTITNAVRKLLSCGGDFRQKQLETSLVERFLYPKLGPGQFWEEVAALVERHGGRIIRNAHVEVVETVGDRVIAIQARDKRTSEALRHAGDYFFSSMPVRELIAAIGDGVPAPVREVAAGLQYRDFITVGLLLKRLKVRNETSLRTVNNIVSDNWIYIQEREVKLDRLQIFNNWSPYMVRDQNTVWVGLEYFCDEGDALWSMQDADFTRYAINELASIDIIDPADVLDSTILRIPKAYPAYFGSYERFDLVRQYTERFANLFLIGRNGMHRYNNADHSMLTAMEAVENVIVGRMGKTNIWDVNPENEYSETRSMQADGTV